MAYFCDRCALSGGVAPGLSEFGMPWPFGAAMPPRPAPPPPPFGSPMRRIESVRCSSANCRWHASEHSLADNFSLEEMRRVRTCHANHERCRGGVIRRSLHLPADRLTTCGLVRRFLRRGDRDDDRALRRYSGGEEGLHPRHRHHGPDRHGREPPELPRARRTWVCRKCRSVAVRGRGSPAAVPRTPTCAPSGNAAAGAPCA